MNLIQNYIRDTIRILNHWEGECGNLCAEFYIDFLLTLVHKKLIGIIIYNTASQIITNDSNMYKCTIQHNSKNEEE